MPEILSAWIIQLVYNDDDDDDDDICVSVPPSYEECTAAGEVDICEENDDQSWA